MNEKKQINFFLKKNSSRWFFWIPIATVIILSIGVLIATSWYSVDYKIAVELVKALQTELGKYWSRFYETLGLTELFILIIIYITILLETWFLTNISKNKLKFKKNYWIVDSFYIVVLVIWVCANITHLFSIPNTNYGFGKGIDRILIDDIKYMLTGTSVAFCFQTLLLCLGLYYVRYHLVKKDRLLKEQFWLKSIKGLSFAGITYIIIVILKGTTAHLYYYNVIFGDLISSHPDLLEAYKNSGAQFGFGADHTGNIPWELQYPWWKPNLGLIQSNPAMPRFNMPWDYAFPSGHINATFITGSGILLFLKNKDNGKVNWKIKVIFALWLTHVLSMNFALIVQRFHWISDTAFTFIFSGLMIFAINITVNKIFAKQIK